MSNFSKRILIIGLDGATFDLIEPWVKAGDLPNLARLMETGSRSRLLSTLQPVTAPAWTTFLTGANQGIHGLYDFVRRKEDGYSLEVTNASHNTSPTLFQIVSQAGGRICAINVPYTYPPRPIHGVMICGPFVNSVSEAIVYPPEFYQELQRIVPGYFVMPDYHASHAEPLMNYTEQLLKEIEQRQNLSLHLMSSQDWDLFMVVFMATDEAQHAFWGFQSLPDQHPLARYRHQMRKIYQRADQAVGALVEKACAEADRETIILVVSDHGAGELKYLINLNRWLAETGFMKFHDLRRNSFSELRTAVLKKAAKLYRQFAPPRLRSFFRLRLGAQRFDQIKGNVESVLFASAIDWENTSVYSLGACGNIFINLKGREPQGKVAPGEEYETLRQKIMDALYCLADPQTGEKIVARIYRREELYHGPHLDQAPDLIIAWKDYAYWGRGRYDSRATIFEKENHIEFTSLPLTGTHRPEGVLIAHGSGIQVGKQIEGARLVDLAPTILGVLGIRPTLAMDGAFLQALFQPEEADKILKNLPSEGMDINGAGSEITTEEAELIAEQLKALGYL